MKMLVTTKQIIIQDVQLLVTLPDDAPDPTEQARNAALGCGEFHTGPGVDVVLYDSEDEHIVETIILSVREATEEESK